MLKVMTKLCFLTMLLAFSVWSVPVPIILDTDIGPDYDDVGAMALLHELANRGEAQILGVVASNRHRDVVPVIEILNRYYGRSDLSVAATKSPNAPELSTTCKVRWPQELIRKYGRGRYADTAAAPAALGFYRRTLAAVADGSVTICTIGFLDNVAELLDSPEDDLSPLSGRELVAKKVRRLVCMAGEIPAGYEFNICRSPAPAQRVFADWPTEIVVSGWELGETIRTGLRIIAVPDNGNPVRDAFAIARSQDGRDRNGRQSWDETAVYFAIRGEDGLFVAERGRMSVTTKRGDNVWVADPNGPHLALKRARSSASIARALEDLMITKSKGVKND